MKSFFVVIYAVEIVKMLSQAIFSMIKVNIDETHENIISKTLQTLNRMCRKENDWILMQIFTDAPLQSNSYHY